MEFLVKNKMYIGFGGCILIAIGCFLPFATALGITIDFIDGDGKILLIAIIVTAILMYLKKDMFSLIPSGIGALVFLNNALKIINTYGIHIGLGFIIILIGLICVIAFPFLKQKN